MTDIEAIEKRHNDLGSSTLHIDGLAKIWINHYLNDISSLLLRVKELEQGWMNAETDEPETGKRVLTSILMSNGEYSEPVIEHMYHKRSYPDIGALVWTGGGADIWQAIPPTPQITVWSCHKCDKEHSNAIDGYVYRNLFFCDEECATEYAHNL